VQNFGEKLEAALLTGDSEQIAQVMRLYYMPGTIYEAGLKPRRQLEAELLLTNGVRSKIEGHQTMLEMKVQVIINNNS
jgi:hypothetical protein